MLGIGVVLGGMSIASAHGFPNRPFGQKGDPTVMFQNDADLLGISVEEVKNAWAEGKDLKTLAKEKGITEETLRSKMKASEEARMKEHLAGLVSSGKITQAQADTMLAEHKNREAEAKAALANALGITVAELESYQTAGKSIDAIIAEKGLNKDTVFAKLRDAHLAKETASIQDLVTKGVLTQEQANKRIETIKTKKVDGPKNKMMFKGDMPGPRF
jgi:competence protein ComGC